MLLMAPRRNNNSASSILVQQQQQHQHHHHHHQQQLHQHQQHHHQQVQHQQQQQQQQQQQRDLLFTASLYNIASNLYEAANSSSNSNSHTLSNNLISNSNTSGSSSNQNNYNNNNSGMAPMQTNNSAGSANGNTIATAVGAHNVNASSLNANGNAHCSSSGGGGNGSGQLNTELFTRCCYPNGDCLKLDTLIALDDLGDCVRVLCNNENCSVGQYMHRECFESWEQSVLVTLKSMGRARSWSERQRSQNLWTKKGYDLVYKVCGCKCGHGHIKKDLEWSPPTVLKAGVFANVAGASGGQRQLVNGSSSTCSNEDEDKKKKKKRNRNNQKPTLTLAPLNSSGYHQNNQQQQQQQQSQQSNGHVIGAQNVLNGNNSVGGNVCSPPNNKNSNASNCSGNSNTNNNATTNSINTPPNPNVGVIGSGLHHSSAQQPAQMPQQQQQQQQSPNAVATLGNIIVGNGNVLDLDLRTRAGSLSSSGDGSGSTSPSASHSSVDISISPIQQQHQQQQQQQHHQLLQLQLQQYQQNLMQNGLSKSILSGINNVMLAAKHQATVNGSVVATATAAATGAASASTSTPIKLFGPMDPVYVQQLKNKEVELYSERVRLTSGCNGIFSRRVDFSSFNLLPKTRLNSYQVKIEDEGNHGNDETRLFILSSLAQSQMSRVACILCEEAMLVFDRYPLVDGSFFLSPKQHSKGCIEVKYEGRAMYLTCVCMACLDGTSTNRIITCRFCGEIWDGSNLVLGTMYAYDIFAAKPCCAERVKCNNCFKLLLPPQQRLSFYSDYSHCVTCPFCATQDTHFVKPLSMCYTRSNAMRHQPVA